jgi:hypothetical protein
MNKGNTDIITIAVSNYLGSTVLFQQLNLLNTNHSFAITGMETLPEGRYTITISWNSGKKIIKQFTKQKG